MYVWKLRSELQHHQSFGLGAVPRRTTKGTHGGYVILIVNQEYFSKNLSLMPQTSYTTGDHLHRYRSHGRATLVVGIHHSPDADSGEIKHTAECIEPSHKDDTVQIYYTGGYREALNRAIARHIADPQSSPARAELGASERVLETFLLEVETRADLRPVLRTRYMATVPPSDRNAVSSESERARLITQDFEL